MVARPRRETTSAAQFVWILWGGWLEQHVLPELNSALAHRRLAITHNDKKLYNQLTKAQLYAYFLDQLLRALDVHKKHQISSERLARARAGLCGNHKSSAIHAQLGFGDHIAEAILNTWPSYIMRFITPGSLTCVDETIFPHYGKIAFDEGKLQCIEGKPWDYGMVGYPACQRLFWTGLPVCLALRVNCLLTRRTPTDLALALLTDAQPAEVHGRPPPCIIADSAWSQPLSLNAFVQQGVAFLIAMKPDNGFVPTGLIDLASSDLPLNHSRTYSDGTFTLQVTRSSSTTTAVVTDMWELPHAPAPAVHRNISYATAVLLFSKESQASLVSMFNLNGADAQKSKERIIFERTGWDPLRPLDEQGSAEPLTYTKAKSMKKAQLLPVYKLRHPRSKNTGITKAEMLHALYPDEAVAAEDAADERHQEQHRKRTRDQVENLNGYREQARFFKFTFYTHSDRH